MQENELWSVGIVAHYGYSGGGEYGWWAKVGFENRSAFARPGVMVGEIGTKYAMPTLEEAVDRALAYAQQIGVGFPVSERLIPSVYYKGDGEGVDPPAPDGWRKLVNDQSRRLGWFPIYEEALEGEIVEWKTRIEAMM